MPPELDAGQTMRRALKTIYTIWLREAKTFWRERARIVAMIGQPLLYLLILGNGITAGMRLNRAGSVGYIQFLYPGVIAMSILFTSIFSALSIIWDREFGFLKEVLVAPVPRWAVAMGKAFGGATIAMVQAIIMIVMAPFVGISLSVMIVAKLLVLAFLMSFAVTSLGIVIALAHGVDAELPDGHELPGHADLLPERRDVPDDVRADLAEIADGASIR